MVLIRLEVTASKHSRKHEEHPPPVNREFRFDSNDFSFTYSCVSLQCGPRLKKRLLETELSAATLLLLTILSTNEKLSVDSSVSETCSVTSYSSGWSKDAVNQCLEFGAEMGVVLSVQMDC